MNERVTFISLLDDNVLSKIEYHTKQINYNLCKVPFGKDIDNREEVDTLPYHFNLSAWSISDEVNIIKELSKIVFPKLKLLINDVEIMNGKENSFVLYFSIEDNEELKLLQQKIYEFLPSEKYNPNNIFKKKEIVEEKVETIQANLPMVVKGNIFTKVWNFIKNILKR